MAYDTLDVLFKLAFHRRPTSESKRLLEEVAQYSQIQLAQRLAQATIDADPAQAVLDGAAALDADLVLTPDPTTPSGEENSVWLTGQAEYIAPDVVPGDLGYTTTIKDGSGAVVPDGKLAEYGVLFLHVNGVLLVQDPVGFAAEYSFPPKLTAYRYVGLKGFPAVSNEIDGGVYGDVFDPVDDIDGGTYS